MSEPPPNLLRYLFDKRGELDDLELKDLVMAKTILDVHRHRTAKTLVAVPLFALFPIHVIDRDEAVAATARRAEVLGAAADELRAAGTLTEALLAEHLPSVSHIKVVPVTRATPTEVDPAPAAWLAYEGNGRIAALQQVFEPADDLRVEVQRYDVDEPEKILRRLNRVRRWNGLDELAP